MWWSYLNKKFNQKKKESLNNILRSDRSYRSVLFDCCFVSSVLICIFVSLALVLLVFVEDEWRLCLSDDDCLLGDFFSRLISIDFLVFSACWWIVSVDFLSRLIFFEPRNSISGIVFDLEFLFICFIFSSFFLSVITILRVGDLLYVSLWRINWSLRVSSLSWFGDNESCFLCLDDVEWVSDFLLCLWVYSESDAELTGESLEKKTRKDFE